MADPCLLQACSFEILIYVRRWGTGPSMKLCWKLAAAMLCILPWTLSATGWVALDGLTAADYQTAFTRWTSAPYGLRLTCITGYDTGAGPRFAAIWTQQSGPGYYTIHQMTAAQ